MSQGLVDAMWSLCALWPYRMARFEVIVSGESNVSGSGWIGSSAMDVAMGGGTGTALALQRVGREHALLATLRRGRRPVRVLRTRRAHVPASPRVVGVTVVLDPAVRFSTCSMTRPSERLPDREALRDARWGVQGTARQARKPDSDARLALESTRSPRGLASLRTARRKGCCCSVVTATPMGIRSAIC